MEETLSHSSNRKKRKKTREEPTPPPPLDLSSTFDRTTFPLLLAALFNTHSSRSLRLVKNFLGSLLLLLLHSQPPPPLPQSFLSLLPLLFSTRPSVAALSMEVVGAASLASIESNASITSDDGIVKGVLWALGSGSRRLAKAACNALMDLAASPVGRGRLRHFSAIKKLLWEGFAHVALHCWNENQNPASCHFSHCRRSMFVNLLHYAIRMIANDNHIFRKACMVAALPLSSDDSLSLKNRATFSYIIKYIDANSSFTEAFKSIKTAVQEKSDESLQWMRWLQHLPQEGDEREKVDFNNLLGAFEELAIFCSDNIEEAMSEFSTIKFRFCRDTVFGDACQCFQLLLEKYRKVRRQYMNGMLSLHSLHN